MVIEIEREHHENRVFERLLHRVLPETLYRYDSFIALRGICAALRTAIMYDGPTRSPRQIRNLPHTSFAKIVGSDYMRSSS